MNLELIVRIILVIINAVGLLMVWWISQSNSKRGLKIWFALSTVFMLLWANFSYLGSRVDNHDLSVLLYRLNWGVVSLFLSSFYWFFLIHFLEGGKFARYLGWILISISLVFFGLSVFTDLVIFESAKQDWGNGIVFGRLGELFNVFSITVAVIVTSYSINSYRLSGSEMKAKLRYFLVGMFIFITANLVFNVGIQLFFKTIQYQFLGDFSSIILLACTAYAIIRHQLFDIKIIATEAITILLWIILFSKLFVAGSPGQFVIEALILIVVVIFGILLVRSVIREVKQREKLEELTRKLEEMDDRKDEFINVAAHELRAPMTAIKGYISMIQEGDAGEVPPTMGEYLQQAVEGNERLIRLVNNMLNVSRIEEGRMVFELGDVDLNEVVKAVVNDYQETAHDKALTLTLTTSPEARYIVHVDKDRIYEVVNNFISNAIKYTDKGGINVKVHLTSDHTVRVDVEDTGLGMTDEEVKHLFQKFYRAESNVGKQLGTGLGLYISKLLIDKFGGKLGVSSVKGKGSTFWFELPLKK